MFFLSFSVPQLSLDAVVGTDDDLVSFSIHLGGWLTCPLSEGGGNLNFLIFFIRQMLSK